MLRKRTRSHQKDQYMGQLNSDVASESCFQNDLLASRHKNTSFFNVPGLFVGFSTKSSESDSVRSPTSPLDFRVFSNFGNPFIRSPRSSSQEGNHHKTWGGINNKVGLSILDSLDYENEESGKVLRGSDSKNILFGPQMRIKIPNSHKHHTVSIEAPKSLPKGVGIFPCSNSRPCSNLQKGSSDVLFHIGESPFEPNSDGSFRPCSLDSGSRSVSSHLSRFANHTLSSGSRYFDLENGSHSKMESESSNSLGLERFYVPATIPSSLIGSIPHSEIELSEDYTCVRKHGPNPKVTHIFGDCILECHNNELTNFDKNNKDGAALAHTADCLMVPPSSYPSSDFLSFCYSCKKKLDGEDIYMYRGEKAFCSGNCRLQEILIDEEIEKSDDNNDNDHPEIATKPSNNEEELFETSLFISS